MTFYNNFIGIDIGKFNFYVATHGESGVTEYENSKDGINLFIKENQDLLEKSFCTLETTGGYEMQVLFELCKSNIDVHRANTRKLKNFIRSYGNDAKTDKLDAKAIALYASERHSKLDLYVPNSDREIILYELVQRRNDLKNILVAEKNRKQAPRTNHVKDSIQAVIDLISNQIDSINIEINSLIAQDENLIKKKEILKSVPGIGEIISNEFVVLLPELGKLNRKEIASLAGVAPKANDSGCLKGYRRTWHGRSGIKPSLFLAAMAARNSKTSLKEFYEKLIHRGKKKKVALTALMRKIIVIANARLKDHFNEINQIKDVA